jgi:uncharacterized protein (TIGR03437 family)
LRTDKFLTALLAFLIAIPVWGQALFVKPVKVFGDPKFIGTASSPLSVESTGPNVVQGRELQRPESVALDTSVSPPIVYVADTLNNRVLAYKYSTQLTAGSTADLVLGQTDLFGNLAQGGSGSALSTGLRAPTAIAVDASGNVYVADTGNNRIVRYPKPFAQPASYAFPNFIIGQKSFAGTTANSGTTISASTLSLAGTGLRNGLAFDSSGNLWVSDTGNNRVLRFPASVLTAGANAPSADIELGQADFLSSVAATTALSKTTLAGPSGLTFDPAGRLLVADKLQRVLVFPAGLTANTAATRILGVAQQQAGQPPPAAVSAVSIGTALGVAATGGVVVVTDTGNNRMLVYGSVDTWPAESVQFSPTASAVIGQSSFSGATANQGNPDPSSGTLNLPFDVAYGSGEFYVADANNNRVLVYSSTVNGPAATASRVIGQLDFAYRAPNLIEGKEFGTVGSGAWGSAILDYSATPPHLYVADTLNNRILGFNNFNTMQNGQVADLVIGQPDFFRAQINYPTNTATTPTAQGLNEPTALAVDSAGNLYVADTGNSRVLRFPAPFASGKTNSESADLVLGQTSFTNTVTDPTSQTMSAPVGLAFTQAGADVSQTSQGFLAVADNVHNRVLFFQKPFSTGMNATFVLGQLNFNSTAGSSGPQQLKAPRGIAIDPQDRVLVADTGNARIQVFGPVSTLSNYSTASFALSTNLSSPVAIGVAPNGQFWVADASSNINYLLHYPTIDKLPPTYAADGSVPAISPRSAFVDQYNNLLVADGVNRILYFAPQVNVVNGANYIPGRSLAPGTIASAFPSASTNVLAGSTQSNPGTLPLPTTLGGAEVLVNNTPAPLFYAAPGQINFALPYELATGGTASIEIVQPTTGQIYGAAEIPLASASPGLFTVGSGQSGQVAALNQDNSLNSSSNALTRGQVLQIFATGQGLVPNAPPDGQASSGLVNTPNLPQVLLGSGSSAVFVPASNIQYSGLAPGFVGVWQINVQIPTTAPSGNVPITVFMNSVPSVDTANPGTVVTTVALK